MELIDRTIGELREFVSGLPVRTIDTPVSSWPAGGPRNIVLGDDVGLELGSPRDESVSCVLWSENLDLINDGRVSLAGPDFPESECESLSYGKVILVGVEGFNEDNIHVRCTELDNLRFDLDLEGFMLRATSQYHREWCRVSKGAIASGFSSGHLARALLSEIRKVPYVRSAELLFVTTSSDDVARVKEIVNPAFRLVAAMNKMANEMDYDCDACEYEDVCDEADGLKSMRDRAINRAAEREERQDG